jgi:hypothetical protein
MAQDIVRVLETVIDLPFAAQNIQVELDPL